MPSKNIIDLRDCVSKRVIVKCGDTQYSGVLKSVGKDGAILLSGVTMFETTLEEVRIVLLPGDDVDLLPDCSHAGHA